MIILNVTKNQGLSTEDTYYVKSAKIRSFSGPYFPAFGLNTERYSVFSPNAGKYGPEKTPYLDTFQGVTFLEKTTGAKRPRPRMSESSFLLI